MEPISILIVDDHERFRQACRDTLQENKLFHVLACTGDPEEAMRIIIASRPQVTLLDISMPVSGFELATRIKEINSDTKIIGLSIHAGITVAQKFLERGGSGYLTKGASLEDISEAIIRVFNGEKYFSKEVQE